MYYFLEQNIFLVRILLNFTKQNITLECKKIGEFYHLYENLKNVNLEQNACKKLHVMIETFVVLDLEQVET